MKKYDALFILNSLGQEDNVQAMIDGVTTCIADAGGKVELIESMDNRTFTRVVDRKHPSGHYFSVVFDISTEGLSQVQQAVRDNEHVFRSSICLAGKPAPVRKPPVSNEENSNKSSDHVSV